MKRVLIIVISLFVASCGSKVYNTPFVNSNETIQLDFGMSKDDVLSIMNEPLFVAYGDNNKITWVYEVRTVEVNSLLGSDGIVPQKTNNRQRHAGPVHRLELTFSDGKLINWGQYSDN